WKEFSEICKLSGLNIDDIFRYYSHVIRARNENTEKEIALRRFYLKEHLKDVDLDSLIKLAKFWFEIRNQSPTPVKEDNDYISIECRKYIQCLNHYPNDYWKYVVSVFFFSEYKEFNEEFLSLLKKLVAFLFAKFIESPTVNAIKTDVFKFCVFVYWRGKKGSMLELPNKDEVFKNIRLFSNSKLTKSLILLHSYLVAGDDQKELISSTFDIEHIFPKKWQDTNYNSWDLKEAESYLERLGNKIPFESRLNIQAGNGYFGKKKEKYALSKIYEVKKLSKYEKSDWNKEDIEVRETQMIDLLQSFFSKNL
ncbi:HNH endonuclease, partial [Ursidibacter maritimus]